jgi:predicted RNase H-like nuclease (RuvC/YqgF family)
MNEKNFSANPNVSRQRYIDNKIQVELSNMRGEVEDIESKVDNCVSLDWFSDEIKETYAYQTLENDVEKLSDTIALNQNAIEELTKEIAKLKGEDNE